MAEEYIYRCDKCESIWISNKKNSICPSCGNRIDIEFDTQYTLFGEQDNAK